MKSIKGLSFYSSEGSLIDVEELYAQVQQLEQDSAAKIIIGETASTTSTTSSDIDELAGTETDISLTNADDFKAGDMGISVVTVTDRNNSHGFMVFLALTDEPDQPAGTLHVRFITGIYNGKDGGQIVEAEMDPLSLSSAELNAMVGTNTTIAPNNQSDMYLNDLVVVNVLVTDKNSIKGLLIGQVKQELETGLQVKVLSVLWSGFDGKDGKNGVDYIVTNDQYSAMLSDGTLEADALYYVIGTTEGALKTANAEVITETEYAQLLDDGDIDDTKLYYIEGTSDGALNFTATSTSYNNSESGLTATNVQGAIDELQGSVEELTNKELDADAIASALQITSEQLNNLIAFAKTIVSSDSSQTVVNNGLAGTGFNTTA